MEANLQYNETTPIWQLTVDQFMGMLKSSRFNEVALQNDSVTDSKPKRYVHGMSGIKKLFNCSYPTARKLVDTIITPAVARQGKVIVVDVDMAMKLFKEHKTVKSIKALKTEQNFK